MKIRAAQINDIGTIANIHFAAWPSVYRGKIPDSYLNTLKFEDFSIRWQSYFRDQINEILVLEDQTTVLGFICFGRCDDQELQQLSVAEIFYIYFDPSVRGKGYGEKLYRQAETVIKSENYKCICIKVLGSVDNWFGGFKKR